MCKLDKGSILKSVNFFQDETDCCLLLVVVGDCCWSHLLAIQKPSAYRVSQTTSQAKEGFVIVIYNPRIRQIPIQKIAAIDSCCQPLLAVAVWMTFPTA